MSDIVRSDGVFRTVGATNHKIGERQTEDYYATDPKALELLLNEVSFSDKVWECACGEGHLSRVLQSRGHDVLSTDIVDRGFGDGVIDFLKYNGKFDGDIITNPPYKYALEFVKHALDIVPDGNNVAMLLRVLFLEGRKRRDFFEKFPPKKIYISSGRINCCKNGDFNKKDRKGKYSALAYAWFIWEKGYSGETIIKWFN